MTKRVARYGRLGPVYEFIPRPAYLFARNLWLDLQSIPRRLSKDHPGPEPWMVLHNYGGSDFYRSGEGSARMLQERLGFGSDAHFLDMGCGTGRVARPLMDMLGEDGAYVGFDVSQSAIAFARKLTRARADAFAFYHADLYSKEYNPRGKVKASEYRFPCADAWVDAAVANSLFTHLLKDDTAHYLRELTRVLKPGGGAYVTVYLINDEVRERMDARTAVLPMLPYDGPVWAGDLATPEAAVGYEEEAFLEMLQAAGLRLSGEIRRGDWSSPPTGKRYKQDAVILKKATE